MKIPFVKDTVATLVATFTQTADKLAIVAEREEADARFKKVEAARLEAEAKGHEWEADRALKIADKIRKLVS